MKEILKYLEDAHNIISSIETDDVKISSKLFDADCYIEKVYNFLNFKGE